MKHLNTYLTIAALFCLSSCGEANRKSATEHGHSHSESSETSEVELTETQLRTVDIKLGHIEQKELGDAIHANGALSVDPQNMADVSSLLPGIVRRVNVVEGNKVRAGQIVAYIENTDIIDLQQNYLAAVDELALATQEYDRQKALDAKNAGIKKNLQQARSAYNTAQAKAESARSQLELIGLNPDNLNAAKIARQAPLTAPISGTVSRINVNTGGYSDMQTPLMTIVYNAAVYCRLNIFEKEVDAVKPGQEVDIRLTNQQSTRLTGTVAEINRSIDSESKAITVRVKLSDTDDKPLVPGMAVTALINAGREKVSVLPDDAVVSLGGKKYIFVVKDIHDEDGETAYHFEKTEVGTGATELGYTQIVEFTPIPKDATVVTSNAFYLASMATDHGEHSH